MLTRSIIKQITPRRRNQLTGRREFGGRLLFALAASALVVGVYMNMGTILNYVKKAILNSEAKDKKFSDILPEDTRQQAAKALIDSLSPEEKAKLFANIQQDVKQKDSSKQS